MAKFSLRRFETQAQVSLLLSLASLATFGATAALMFWFLRRGLQAQEFIFYYGSRGRMAVLLAVLVTLMLAVSGFGFGLNSAGQRRNDKQQLSWIGFFIGAFVLTLTLVLAFVFVQRGEMVIR